MIISTLPRPVRLCLTILSALVVLLTLLPATAVYAQAPVGDGPAAPGSAPAPVRFAFLSDTHVGAAGWSKSAPLLAAALRGLSPVPAFLVHGGDVTETGAVTQYRTYLDWLAGLNLMAYHVPGNHDARWLDAGKGTFRRLLGDPYRSFDYQGLHFVLLDSTTDAESHGHLDGPVLKWLRADLERVGPQTPVLVFLHHPATYPPASFMDNEEELFALLSSYRVLGVFTGHGHLHMQWRWNDLPVFMVQAADQGGFQVVDVDPASGRVQVQYGTTTAAGTSLTAAASVQQPVRPPRRLQIKDLLPLAADSYHLTVEADLPAGAKVYWRISSGQWRPMAEVAGRLWAAAVSTAGLPPGRHRLHVFATTGTKLPREPADHDAWREQDLGPNWGDFRDLSLTAGTDGPVRPLWQIQAGAGIQGSPAADGAMVYVASRDGGIFGINAQTGAPVWRYVADGALVGGVEVDGRRQVYVGDAAGYLHAVSASTGERLWQTRVGGPVVGPPLAAAGRVLVADMLGRLSAADPTTGKLLWQYETGAPVRAGLAQGAGKVFVGTWDGSVHAIDVGTGARRWRTALPGSMYFSPANARPLYYRGRVYLTRTPPEGGDGLFALDATDGRVLWSRQGSFGYSAPILHGGNVVVTKTGGDLMHFDPSTGDVRAQAAAAMTVFDASASSFGGDLVVGGLSGTVTALSPQGSPRWRYSLGETYIYARPTVDGGRIYAAAMDGTLTALAPLAPPPAAPLTLGTPGLPAQVPAAGFPDTAGHWAEPFIAWARAMGLAGGGPDGTFGPDQPVTRAQLAVMTARWLGRTTPPAGYQSKLPDVKGHWAEAAIVALEVSGLAGGVPGPNGTVIYAPDATVTRAQATALLARLVGRLGPAAGFQSQLADLQGHWAREVILSLEEIGLVSGNPGPDGRPAFRPDEPMTRAQAATLLVRAALGE